jgi:hypothetical protein
MYACNEMTACYDNAGNKQLKWQELIMHDLIQFMLMTYIKTVIYVT